MRGVRAIGAGFLCLGAGVGFAQTGADRPYRFDVKLGYLRDYSGDLSVTSYNVAAFGRTLSKQGTAPEFTDFSAGGLADVKGRPLFLNVQRGLTSAGGSLLQGFTSQPLSNGFLPGLADFSIVVGADAQIERLSRTTYTAQLEYKAVYPLRALQRALLNRRSTPQFAEFATFGAGAQREVDENGKGRDRAVLTGRGAIARSFYFSSRTRDSQRQNEVRTALGEAFENVEAVEAAYQQAVENPGILNGNPVLTAILSKYQVGRSETALSQGEWDVLKEREFFLGPAGSPDLTFWLDGNVRLAVAGASDGRAFRGVWSANAKLFLTPGNAKSEFYLQLQYINGFQEATPTSRSNGLIFQLGARF